VVAVAMPCAVTVAIVAACDVVVAVPVVVPHVVVVAVITPRVVSRSRSWCRVVPRECGEWTEKVGFSRKRKEKTYEQREASASTVTQCMQPRVARRCGACSHEWHGDVVRTCRDKARRACQHLHASSLSSRSVVGPSGPSREKATVSVSKECGGLAANEEVSQKKE
jgi:hypothetical protein